LWGECRQNFTDGGADGMDGSGGGFSEQVFELGKDLFDRLQVW
jgi:hypothetical protein